MQPVITCNRDMRHPDSSYYPPRAKWYSPLFQLGNGLRRHAHLDRLQLPGDLTWGIIFKGLWWPGLALWVQGEKRIGRILMLGGALLAAIFIVWLGYPIADTALGLLLAAHVTSLVFLCRPWLANRGFWVRTVFTLSVLFLVSLLIYLPLRNLLQTQVLRPLRYRGQVVVVQKITAPAAIHRGDWVAYELPILRSAHRGVRFQPGLGLGPVLAVAGDRIEFTPNGLMVNGKIQSARAYMPQTGEMTVPKDHWFIWPDLATDNRNRILLSEAMQELALVRQSNFIGKPFHRWFGRKQLTP
ncbi:MAG: S26 family signal peptidase [Verrucomicrobiae bacterium]|nr:S26 family signal peptidase [Verrucomicrobiae bacterium]